MKNLQLFFGKPVTAPCLIPVSHAATPTCINEPFMVGSGIYRVTALSFGNAHGAVAVDDIDGFDVNSIGEALGNHPRFPKGANIVFFQALDKGNIKARLWQKGEGEKPVTHEAVCVAGTASIMVHAILKNEVNVSMGGHVYTVRWDRGKGVTLSDLPNTVQVDRVTAASA